jgi:ERO1-like protein alpha
MNILHVIVPLLFFLGGLELLRRTPGVQEDPLEQMNSRTAEVLARLVQTKYFRIIRLNINEDCSLGIMKRICRSSSCTVCRCEDSDIPALWTTTEKVVTHSHDRDLWAYERSNGKGGWVWHVEDEANDRGEYFDIHSNIESFTNYNGSYIWNLIYQENCFKGHNLFDQMCLE